MGKYVKRPNRESLFKKKCFPMLGSKHFIKRLVFVLMYMKAVVEQH